MRRPRGSICLYSYRRGRKATKTPLPHAFVGFSRADCCFSQKSSLALYWYHLTSRTVSLTPNLTTAIRPSGLFLLLFSFSLASSIWNNQVLMVHRVDTSIRSLHLAATSVLTSFCHQPYPNIRSVCSNAPDSRLFSTFRYLDRASPLNGRRPKVWGVSSLLDQPRCFSIQVTSTPLRKSDANVLSSGAGMHRHEYSNPQTVDNRRNSVPRRSPLTRAAFSTPLPRKSNAYEKPTPIIKSTTRPLSDIIPRTSEPIVRFQEPEPDTMSEDGRSVANSEVSVVTVGGRRRRRSIRSSTAYSIAHPAPTLTQKQKLLQIRPKLLLQLQRLSTDCRPKPALDVLPSTVVVPRLTKKFPRMFKGKAELGCHDVMVVKSEEYDAVDDGVSMGSDSDEDSLANRDLIAVICQARKDSGGSYGKAEIVLNDGSTWLATPLPNGLYEFVTMDERGNKTTARWVRRSTKARSTDAAEPATVNTELKFTFSILDPNTRRHPILASLTQSKLDIPDYYTSVSSSAGKHPPTSPRAFPGEPEQPFVEGEPSSERTTHAVDESMKTLIRITSVWVALREGWSPYFKYNDASIATVGQQTTPGGRVRSMSLTPDASRPSPVATASSTPESSHSAFGRIRRQSCRASPANTESSQQERSNGPKRAVSAGTAFMQRAAARRAGNPPSTVASDSEGEGYMGPSLHVATENLQTSLSNRASTPPGSLFLPGSSTTTPDTPTRPQRRVQSAYIPTSALQNGFTYEQPGRHSTSITIGEQTPNVMDKPAKVGRWKAFTNLFKRTNSSSRYG